MPFEPMEIYTRPATVSAPTLSYKRKTTSHGRTKPKLVLFVPKPLAGDFTTTKGQRFALHLGNGKDAGKARVLPAVTGGHCTPLQHGFTFYFGFLPYLGESSAEKEPVTVRAITVDKAQGFEIDLPAWFKPDEDGQ